METLKRKIKALSVGRLAEGSIGFITAEDEGKWYNVAGDKVILEELMKNVVAKGNTIEFEFNNGIVGSIKLIEKAKETDKKNWTEDMTNFEDLLNAAHKEFGGKLNIKTELISVDYEKKRAMFSACVSVEYGPGETRVFTGHGDAEGIGSEMIKPHFIRMAETRAIARALRWATNNAEVSEEETTGEKEDPNVI